ncbi:TlpA family protein disulfide reductase [Halalkalibaculum sp. DA3122]|uniref:TlpA family protein disulfide reductase n=1 Tax=Halalkalibaculum sp. DA3122 TaxID=3373607 RepID=UPI00375436A7
MRIDPRHFNKFMAGVAVVAAILIAIATLNYTSGREDAFQRQMMEADSLGLVKFPRITSGDSLQLNQFRGQYLLLDFWSTWSEASTESHAQLAAETRGDLSDLAVIAASVRNSRNEILEYRQTHNYPFVYVDGTAFYRTMNLPGVPSQVLFDKDGEVVATFVGYTDSTRYDSLKAHIRK